MYCGSFKIQMPVCDISGVFLNHLACYFFFIQSQDLPVPGLASMYAWMLDSELNSSHLGRKHLLYCRLFAQTPLMYTLQIQSIDNVTQHFQQFIVLSKDSACCTVRKKKYYYLHQPYGHTTAVRNQRYSSLCAVGIVTTGIRCVQGNWAVEEQLKNADSS